MIGQKLSRAIATIEKASELLSEVYDEIGDSDSIVSVEVEVAMGRLEDIVATLEDVRYD